MGGEGERGENKGKREGENIMKKKYNYNDMTP